MKIVIVGPGIMPIPPSGWGAVEILIWDSKVALEKLGHTVEIVNTQSPMEIIKKINENINVCIFPMLSKRAIICTLHKSSKKRGSHTMADLRYIA